MLTSAKTSSAFYLSIFLFRFLQFSRQQRKLLCPSMQGAILVLKDHSPMLSEQQTSCAHTQRTVPLHPVQRCGWHQCECIYVHLGG